MSGVDLQAFVEKWTASGASERANKDQFLIEFCEALGVPRPNPTTGNSDKDVYVFEKDAPVLNEGGSTSVKKIDLYKAGHFILEAKQGSEAGAKKLGTAKRNTYGWNQAMNDAFGQAVGYARSFDEPEPFIVVCDIGYCFELYSNFAGDWQYRSFPNAQQKRIYLKDLPKNPALVERLKLVFTDPHSLDPAKHAAKVTRKVAAHLAELAKRLEAAGHHQVSVAKFLMRCLFTMFAEDVGLLPGHLFTEYLKNFWVKSPESFPGGIQSLWHAMNTGGHLPTAKILKFNGGLFVASEALPLDVEDIKLLLKAAECDWSDVEPAIFGTLLERALDPEERHKLGAHYTPRAYVDRLVRPTIEEPLREEWDAVRIEVRQLVVELNEIENRAYSNKREESSQRGAATKKKAAAAKLLRDFHHRLLNLRILDPACGTGNFLYVAMDTLKRLESEVLAELEQLEGAQDLLHVVGARISPEQFLGIEIKPWAKEIAELVLWIGYLQWHFKQYGKTVQVPEPVLRDYKNIECRDALLAYDKEELVVDEVGKPVTRWDGKTKKVHPVTGKEVPDESATRPLYRYVNSRQAVWPKADFVVGNPPFLGKLHFLDAFGEGYMEALRSAYKGFVPNSADLVMYWWARAAKAVSDGQISRSGLVTTNSITQVFNRRVVDEALAGKRPVILRFAIPDHPWVDLDEGAAVRIAMTVVGSAPESGPGGRLLTVEKETSTEGGHSEVVLTASPPGPISASLRPGVDVTSAKALKANQDLCSMGPAFGSRGFILDRATRDKLVAEDGPATDAVIVRMRGGKDYLERDRDRYVIDFHGCGSEATIREKYPATYAHIYDRVYPERKTNKDKKLRDQWWLFRRSNETYRSMLKNLPRFVVTVETAKHRLFFIEEGGVVVEHGNICFGLEAPWAFGVLSSRVHVTWALASGGTLEDRPRYNKSVCFDNFPFPSFASPDHLKAIEDAARDLHSHRQAVRERHPTLQLTPLYNVVEKLRSEEPLNAKERGVADQGLTSVLLGLHQVLDSAVLKAYGWPDDLSAEQMLERLVALNKERSEEERRGVIRWLRPEFQNPGHAEPQQQGLRGVDPGDAPGKPGIGAPAPKASQAWPKKLPEQISVIRDLVAPGTSWSAAAAAGTFKYANVEQVREIMESLGSLGLLIQLDRHGEPVWTAPRMDFRR